VADVEERIGSLYVQAPEEFVAGRNELAKQLRADGDRDAAERVKGLRRPSQAAWLINRVAAEDAELIRGLVEAADRLAEAQREVLERGGDPADLRAAAAQERERVEEVIAAARGIAGDASETTIERVGQTLQAVASDPELRDRVLAGRVEREQRAATFGISGSGTPRTRPRDAKRDKRRERERARGELERLRTRLREAEARRDLREASVEEAERQRKRARAELAEARAEVRDLERQIDKAERAG
jgi:hypothetical protein